MTTPSRDETSGPPATLEQRIASLARRQYGVASLAQLVELGLRKGTVNRWTRRGRLSRLHRGVLLLTPILPSRGKEMAAVLACGSGALVSHRSALALHGVLPEQGYSAPVDVTLGDGRDARSRAGIRLHRTRDLRPDERAEIGGIPATTLSRALVDFAAVAGSREVEQAIARAEREHQLDRSGFAAMLDRYAGRRGIAMLRAVVGVAGGPALTRSEAEARFLALIRSARLPVPESNVVLDGYELDFFWRSAGIAVEVDGYRYHSSRPRFESDRRRATRLASRGIQVISVTWRQIVDQGVATAVQIGQALVHAEVRH